MGDVWRVSELSEKVIVALASTHGANVGDNPKRRVIVRAIWETKNLAAGGRSERWHRQQSRRIASIGELGAVVREDVHTGEAFAHSCYRDILLASIEDRLRQNAGIQRAYRLMRAGYSWEEIGNELGGIETNDAWRKRFWRIVRNASRQAKPLPSISEPTDDGSAD